MPSKKPIRRASASSKVIGDALERKVAQSYEALGFQVARDQLIEGHQIDLVASRYISGLGVLRIAIEAKHREGTLGINEVTPFLNTARHLLASTDISSVILVTNGAVSPKAKLAVGTSSIRVMTTDELNSHLFNNAESLFRVIKDYEQRSIFRDYYTLEVDVDSTYQKDGASYLTSWINKASDKLLLVIGDFGSGKSTLLERCFYDAAQERLKDETARFPILLKLRGMRQYSDIWSFIESSLRDNQYLTPPKAVFDNELRSGRVAVLLDGFDEIYSGADARDRADYLDFLRPLLKTKSPVILSSRPTFFDSFDDLISSTRKLLPRAEKIERLPSFGLDPARIAEAFGAELNQSLRRSDFSNIMLIRQLDEKKIKEAIVKRADEIQRTLNMTADQFESRLYEIYDLEDLMTRPLLLDMILKTMATGVIDIKSQKTVGASTLYDVYTQQAAKRDKDRSIADQFLTPSQRLEACRSLARAMYHKGEITLSPAEVSKCVQEVIGPGLKRRKYSEAMVEVGRAITDIRTCSFLRFSDDESFSFAHKSFYEFFVAQDVFLKSKVNARSFLAYPRARLSREMLYFLASYIRDQPDFRDFVSLRMRDRITKADKSFLQSLAFASAELLERNALTSGTVSGVEMVKAEVTGAEAMMVAIQSSAVRKVTAWRWKFHDVQLESCQFSDFSLHNSVLEASSHDVLFERCNFLESRIELGGDAVTFHDADVQGGKFTLDCKVSSTSLNIGSGCEVTITSSTRLSASRTSFRASSVFAESPWLWYTPGSTMSFEDCDLMCVRLLALDLVVGVSGRTDRRISLRDCTGLVFVDMTDDILKNDGLASVRRLNPELLIVDEKTYKQARSATIERTASKKLRGISGSDDNVSDQVSDGARGSLSVLPSSLRKFNDDLIILLAKRNSRQAQVPKAISEFMAAVS